MKWYIRAGSDLTGMSFRATRYASLIVAVTAFTHLVVSAYAPDTCLSWWLLPAMLAPYALIPTAILLFLLVGTPAIWAMDAWTDLGATLEAWRAARRARRAADEVRDDQK